MNYGGAKTMKSGGKATAKPKMAAGGATKKKYAMGTTVSSTGTCKDGDPKCKEGTYNAGRGTGPMSKLKAAVQNVKMNIGAGRIKKRKV